MYTFFRRLHLFSSAILLGFVLMYFVTGYVLVHEKWFPRATPASVTSRQETLRYTAADISPDNYDHAFDFIRATYHVRGQQGNKPAFRGAPVVLPFIFQHPGSLTQIFVDTAPHATPAATRSTTSAAATRPATNPATPAPAVVTTSANALAAAPADVRVATVTIKEQTAGAAGTMNQFHRLRGFGRGSWVYDLWTVFYDLSAIAMIVFAVSGIFLWYKLTRRHTLGFAILGVSFAYAIGTYLYLALAP